MNERIDDVAMIANDQTGNKFDLNHKELDVFLKKYAELIIKECAEVASDYDGAHYVGTAIENHFGVE